MAPPSRRRILPVESLGTFHASPIFSNPSTNNKHSTSFSADACVASPIGIRIGGWNIQTQNSAIGNEREMDELTTQLEGCAADQSSEITNQNRKRRLCPPEITFLDAVVSLQYEKHDSFTATIRFTARDALLEWAASHRFLDSRRQDQSHRGVSILRTIDADVWSHRITKTENDGDNNESELEFYYDWTFASPYVGTTLLNETIINKHHFSKQDFHLRDFPSWKALPCSCIPFPMLQDTTQPILLYDDILLYEDDLHDNGDVSLSVKLRVMPKCWYLLMTLFLRVDYVCVKSREIRLFSLFHHEHIQHHSKNTTNNTKPNTIYRDITWKEASWEQLKKMGMPLDPAAWRQPATITNHNANRSINTSSSATIGGMGMPPLASLLKKLPLAQLPQDLPMHSCLDLENTTST